MEIPDSLVAGDTWRFTVDVPSGGWTTATLEFAPRAMGGLSLKHNTPITAGGTVDIEVPAGTTGLAIGRYAYSLSFTIGAEGSESFERRTDDYGEVDIVNRLLAGATPAEQRLAALEAVLAVKLSGRGDVSQYAYGGRMVTSFSLAQLQDAVARARWEVNNERRRGKPRQMIL